MRCAGWHRYWDGTFCSVHMENCLGKQDKNEIKMQNNFLRAWKNLTWKPWYMYGVCTNISVKKVTKLSNSQVRSDLQIVRSRIAGLLFSPLWQYLTFLSSSHLLGWLSSYEQPLRKRLCTFRFHLWLNWDETAKLKN